MANSKTTLTAQQQANVAIWEEHMRCEFETKDLDAVLKTMVPDAYVNHIPTMTGAHGLAAIKKFYGTYFIPCIPDDTETILISRTVGDDQLVDELVMKFTHNIEVAWFLPGIPPTGKKIEQPIVVIVKFRDGKLAHEHIYWDQASILVQLDLLDKPALPILGKEIAGKVLDPTLPGNQLLDRVIKA